MAKTEIKADIGLDTTKFQRGMAKAQRSVKNFAKSGVASMVRFGAAFAGVGLVKSIIGLGTAAAETASKFNAVFGPAADALNSRILELKKSIPATTMEMQNALATFGAMGKAFGLNSAAANEFSVNMVKIAGDLASFHNLRPEEAFQKIQSAISGEFEPMKQLGIVINEATLKQEALNLAIWDGTGQMSAAQKAITVQSLLIKQMGVAQGDAAATAESASNRIKFLNAQLKDTGAEIGNTVLPAVVKLVGWMSKLATTSKEAAEKVGMIVAGGRVGDDPLDGYSEAAKQKLTREGRLLKTGKGGVSKHAQLLQIKVVAQELKDAHDKRIAAKEKEVKAEEKVTEAVVDPKRKKAADDYLTSLQNQIKAAGKLASIQGAKPPTRAGGTSPTGGGTSPTEQSRRRKFGETLTRFDPTTGKTRKFGESFSSADASSHSQQVKDAIASLAAKNASGEKGSTDAEAAAKSSADSLKVIEAELTRTK